MRKANHGLSLDGGPTGNFKELLLLQQLHGPHEEACTPRAKVVLVLWSVSLFH